jgi:N-acylneuraminate cytidylyltransferase/CMP-N,N'-diacetyllegionaminic acid synthase
MSRRILGLIPARGGSKGIPRKNVRELGGKPLIAHSIEAGLDSAMIESVVVSSDDPEIISVSKTHGADVPFQRPDSLATDDAATAPVVAHAIETLETTYDLVVLLQPTSPLRTAKHIDEAVNRYLSSDADSLVSVYQDHTYRWQQTGDGAERIDTVSGRKRRQDMDPEYVENGAIYIVSTDQFFEEQNFSFGRTVLYEMTETASIDIDAPDDLRLAECLVNVADP